MLGALRLLADGGDHRPTNTFSETTVLNLELRRAEGPERTSLRSAEFLIRLSPPTKVKASEIGREAK